MSQPQQVKVMVIGAAGNIGSYIVHHLQQYPHFSISALTRLSSKSSFPATVTPIRSEYSFSSLTRAFDGQDIVICAITTSGLGDQMIIARAAVEAGVKRYIPAEFGLDTSTELSLKVAPSTYLKKDVIKYLRENEDRTSWTAVITGLWIDWSMTNEHWTWWSLQDRRMTIFDDGDTPFETTTLNQAGKAVVAAILPENLEVTKNEYMHIRSAVFTSKQLLESMKKYTKTTEKDWTVEFVNLKELGEQGQAAFHQEINSGQPPEVFSKSEKFMGALSDMITAGLMGYGGVNQFGDKPKPWMERLKLFEEDAEEIVKKVVEGWTNM